ncbi:NDP-hexose 2,3-dehydratase family protein [Streptomyces hainanensis]|uniref:NDP-hexose 2,3-dehydratase n=1 Tax=Streptomyces hainanensis TaxID=402648 RepID=A0A4R4T2E4_9ACTN|nr:NDP-hexose 2,3-dehydratase family protein [Streptomyces hainanensis]TDC69112.1 NDP-hexose 2,3-dehydratase [Streptomyces hainanensis]
MSSTSRQLDRAAATAGLTEFLDLLDATRRSVYTRAERVPLDELAQWHTVPGTGALRHVSGRFFTVEGIEATVAFDTGADAGEPRSWRQPVIVQPEIGILGILLRLVDGTPHFLMQLKAEPGNVNGIQVSPTVQATRSNYTRVHGGRPVPYLEYFRGRHGSRTVADVRQSEQGGWFLRKRNRNMIVAVDEPVPVLDGFHWLTVEQLAALLTVDDLVNMDARSVLACLPLLDVLPAPLALDRDEPARSVLRSWGGLRPARHSMTELLSWITDVRSRTDVEVRRVPLDELPEWRSDGRSLTHVDGRHFDVIGVRVEAGGREVGRWDQPMVAARSVGLSAFVASRLGGVLHVLVALRAEPGLADVAELGPTVQCVPDDPVDERPPLLGTVLDAAPERVRYDTTLSEEGGRFFHTRTRYRIVELAPDADRTLPGHPDLRWMTLHQLGELVRHSHYVTVQARTLLAACVALAAGEGGPA